MFKGLKDKLFSVSSKAEEKSVDEISEVVDESGRRLKYSVLDDLLHDLELELMGADVALPVAEALTKKVRDELVGQRVDKSFRIDEAVTLALKAAVRNILSRRGPGRMRQPGRSGGITITSSRWRGATCWRARARAFT